MTSFPTVLRRWRTTRATTQAQLAADAEISTRHLSFLESGKARPSRQMVLLLSSALDLELRDRNTMLLSAGFAPMYGETPLDDEAMSPLRRAMDLVLQQQEPYGAIAVNRRWEVIGLNQGAARLFAAFMPDPIPDPIIAQNLVHAMFHPEGLRPVIVNWEELCWSFVARLHRETEMLPEGRGHAALLAELSRYPDVPSRASLRDLAPQPFLTVHLRRLPHDLRLFTVLTAFGTPLDVTAQELTIETFYPADEESDAQLRRMADGAH
jgi:transcriptional regulator with XRE-family HTH domain